MYVSEPETTESLPQPPPVVPAEARAKRTFGRAAVVLFALLGLVLGGALGVGGMLLLPPATVASDAAPSDVAPSDTQSAVQLYQCPMHPTIVQDHPGDCPICGMKLVPMETPAQGVPEQVKGLAPVSIDPARQQLIGVKTVDVSSGPIGGAWRTVGRIAMDETRIRRTNLKVSGFVERIYVDFVGKKVRKGDPLFSLYSPELLSTQEELLLALRTKKALTQAGNTLPDDGDALVAAARRKLALWDVPEAEIERLAKTGEPTKTIVFHSPIAGVVTRKDVVEGMRLDAGAMPYEIVDLSSVWVLADVYESELRFVKDQMAAKLTLNAYPNHPFTGKVVFIDPLLDPQTRTVKVRLVFPNPTGELRPEMFGEVVLLGAPHDGLRIPPDAVIDSGTEKLVFVALGEGKFEPRKVTLGDSDGTNVEVTSGVAAGEHVVTRAGFLIDSESRLRASLAEMSGNAHTDKPASARVLPAAPSSRAP